jgi:inosine/xanthosine triphosphatase
VGDLTTPLHADTLSFVRTVRVGSLSAPKIEAVRSAIGAYLPGAMVAGRAADSGVSDQPVGWSEIVAGARNRARAAFDTGGCELAVGIEDGLVVLKELESETLNIGAAVVTDGEHESLGLSAGFSYPASCLGPALKEREPIGNLFDRIWRLKRAARGERAQDEDVPSSGVSIGNIGKLSLGVLTRSEYGRHAVLCALIRFLHPELYGGSQERAERHGDE